MSRPQKTTVYRPVVEKNHREAAASCKEFAAEDKATELALRAACEDPTEREYLSGAVDRMRARLKAAVVELARAFSALLFAWLARALLNHSYRKITAKRGEVGRGERSALALQNLLSSFFIRRIVGGRGLLKALGASSRTDDEDNSIHSLKVGGRSYSPCDGHSLAAAASVPEIRVLLGVRVGHDGEPVWCLKRFVCTDTGLWRELHSSTVADAGDAMIHFYMEPSHDHTDNPAGFAAQELQQPRRTVQNAA